MALKRLNVGARMSDVVMHNGVAYLSGKVPRNPEAGIAEQTKDVLAIIDELLAGAGTSKESILRAEIYLSDIKNFGEMNKVWDAWVPSGSTPGRATVEAKLANPQYLVEIVVTAAI
jgi:enamine deaminase RidA (YjgF/YER057c/UK114 family)